MIVKVELTVETEYYDVDVIEQIVDDLISRIDPQTSLINLEAYKVDD